MYNRRLLAMVTVAALMLLGAGEASTNPLLHWVARGAVGLLLVVGLVLIAGLTRPDPDARVDGAARRPALAAATVTYAVSALYALVGLLPAALMGSNSWVGALFITLILGSAPLTLAAFGTYVARGTRAGDRRAIGALGCLPTLTAVLSALTLLVVVLGRASPRWPLYALVAATVLVAFTIVTVAMTRLRRTIESPQSHVAMPRLGTPRFHTPQGPPALPPMGLRSDNWSTSESSEAR